VRSNQTTAKIMLHVLIALVPAMVMSAVQMEFVKETLQYKLLKQEFDSDMEPVESEFEQYNAFEAFDTVYYYSGDQSNNASRLGSFYAS
jgi:hypothetical protein